MGDFLQWLLAAGVQVVFLILVVLLVPALLILILGIATGIDDRIQR